MHNFRVNLEVSIPFAQTFETHKIPEFICVKIMFLNDVSSSSPFPIRLNNAKANKISVLSGYKQHICAEGSDMSSSYSP